MRSRRFKSAKCTVIHSRLCISNTVHCIVTAGPTFESLDSVRRLTNHSTGTLGSQLANSLVARGHQVTLVLGETASYVGEQHAHSLIRFSSTENLLEKLTTLSAKPAHAVFHAAAVSDFRFGKLWREKSGGKQIPLIGRKIATADGRLLAELIPTLKIIARLRTMFPTSILTGWKYEVEKSRSNVIDLARAQIVEHNTDYCVANGPAYGSGYGILDSANLTKCRDKKSLFAKLEGLLWQRPRSG